MEVMTRSGYRKLPSAEMIQFECLECGKKFEQQDADGNVECPACNGLDVDLA